MKRRENILSDIDRQSGMTVPPGYFESFTAKMIQELPVRDEAERPNAVILPSPTLWTRIRPYVYLAAMFAGIWCMLKMFTLMSSPSDNASVDKNPILAEAFRDDTFINDYITDDIDEFELLDEMIEDGFDTSLLQFDDSIGMSNLIDPADPHK